MRRSIPLVLLGCLTLPAIGAAQEQDEMVRRAFLVAFGTAPAASQSMESGRSPEADAAIAAGRSAVASPTNRALRAEFADRLGALVDSQGNGNIIEVLLWVIKESVSEMNEDKRYWLSKLAEQNEMSAELSEYLKELSEASQKLGAPERMPAPEAPISTTVPVTVRTFDPVWLEALSEPSVVGRATICDPCLMTRATTLNAEQVQREQESTLGLQRRLQSARKATEARRIEIERRSDEVVRMMAEVLRVVDDEREGRIDRATRLTS